MAQEGRRHQLAVTDFVGDQRAEDNDDPEAGQTTTGDSPQLGHRESELIRPLAQDSPPDGVAHTSREDGHKASPEQSVSIRRDGVAAVAWNVFGIHTRVTLWCGVEE